MGIKAIVFDWGGVLAPCDNKIGAIRLGKNFELDSKKFEKYYGDQENNFCHLSNHDEFLLTISNKFDIPVDSIICAFNADPPDEEFEIARELSKNYKTYILSNQLKFRTDYIKKNFDLSFFQDVFFSNEIGLKKPSREIFEFLLKKINQKPQDCLFVDDCRENVNMAKRIGFNVILFKSLKQFNRELVNLKIA